MKTKQTSKRIIVSISITPETWETMEAYAQKIHEGLVKPSTIMGRIIERNAEAIRKTTRKGH